MKRLILLALAAVVASAGLAQAQLVTTVYDLQQGLVAENTEVLVEGLIVTAPDLVSGGRGFFCQEAAGGPHSGIYVYVGPSDPDPVVIVGDVVDVHAIYQEYNGLAELDETTVGGHTIVGSTVPPDPQLLRAADLQTYIPVAAGVLGDLNPIPEQWESVLCRVENVRVIDLNEGFGSAYIEEFGFAVNDTLLMDDDLGPATPPVFTEMLSVTGVVWYAYDFFRLEPRTDADIVYSGAAPAPQIEHIVATGMNTVDVRFDREVEVTTATTATNYFLDVGSVASCLVDAEDNQLVHLTLAADMAPELLLTMTVFGVQNTDGVPMAPDSFEFWGAINTIGFSQIPDAGGDSSAVAGQIITIRGVIHRKYDVWGSAVYLQEVNEPGAPRSPYNGIEIYLPALLDSVQEGDIVTIGDPQTEYYNMTSMVAPFYYFNIESSGNTVLPPEEITIGDMTDVSTFETYEGALVEVKNVTVVERAGDWNFYTWSVSQDGLNWLQIGDMGDYDYVEGLGDTLNIRGALRYEFGQFVLMPRSDDDIDILYQNPNSADDLPAGAKIALAQNHPNPFNPRTKISFALKNAGHATVEVFDTQGRLIKSLFAGDLGEGRHEVIWNGDADGGESVASGLYFYSLKADGESQTRKMLLLK